MMDEHEYALGEVDRRLANVLRFGTITAVDTAKGLAKVDLGDMVTDWVPWSTPRAGNDRVWSTPDVGEQVALLSPGDPSMGVITGSLFQSAHPQNGNDGKDRRVTFSDGTVLEFDRSGSVMNITVNPAGNVNVTVGATELHLVNGSATLKASTITLDGDVTVTGATSVQGITSRGHNISNTHTHTLVTPGAGTSGPPP